MVLHKEIIKSRTNCRIIIDIELVMNYALFVVINKGVTSQSLGAAKHRWLHQCRTHYIWQIMQKQSKRKKNREASRGGRGREKGKEREGEAPKDKYTRRVGSKPAR